MHRQHRVNLDLLRSTHVATVLQRMGATLRGDRADLCPLCGSRDRRAVQLYRDGGGHCHRCDDGWSDGLALLWGAAGGRSATPRDVGDLAESLGFEVGPEPAQGPTSYTPPPPPPPPSIPKRERAPRADLARLVSWSSEVGEETGCDVAAWLAGRGLPTRVDPRTARALWPLGDLEERLAVHDLAWPAWATEPGRDGGPWCAEGYGLIGCAYGAGGRLEGLRARWTGRGGRGSPPRGPKEISGGGVSVSGLVYADEGGRAILRGDLEVPGALWIVEGLPDLIAVAEAAAQLAPGPTGAPRVGVWGIWSGSLRPEVCETIPESTVVYAATDGDRGGWLYARRIADRLGGHPLRRALPEPGRDWADMREAQGSPLDLRSIARHRSGPYTREEAEERATG